MDEKRNTGEFSLEDILKEFGDESIQPQEQEDVLIWDGSVPENVGSESPFPQDTVRLDEITKVVRQQSADLDQTMAFTPVGQEEEEDLPMPVQEPPKAEPYSDEWEPEYEQPINDYIPPEPIVYHPKSRLRELKNKLVAGPENRYNA